jgi:diguanylate cyclase (GGDEF)-like protein
MSCVGVIERNAAGQPVRVIGSHSDVTADTVADPVTGLPNRLLFLEHLARAIDRANRNTGHHFAVLSVDLDLPAADETLLPAAGDPLLTAAARRLETSVRVEDPSRSLHNDLVARLQDDRFAILLEGLKHAGHAKVIADRILWQILAPFAIGDREVFLSASIGIAVSATGYSQADDVLRDAETALHRARLLGKGCCEVFDTAILKSAQTELRLEADFDEAIERREFLLFYQPIVAVASNQIVGFEALVRWKHPVLGMLSALEFVATAERTDFIVPLGDWVLREACRQLKAWQDDLQLSSNVWISVNLSSVQLRHPTLLESVAEALRSSALDPRCLVLELTEGLAMENPTVVKSLLMQLRAMGVRISVDDFGTGHSSLAYLRKFPVDCLKVDRSLVWGIEANQDMAHIFSAVTAMGHQLGLRVVAEGIDSEEQLARVRALHCEYGQGYLFSKPVDHEAAAALLKTGIPRRASRTNGPEPVAPLRRDGPASEEEASQGRPRAMRGTHVVAAILTLLVSAGLVASFSQERRPAARSAWSQGPEAQLSGVEGVAVRSAPAPPAAPAPRAPGASATSSAPVMPSLTSVAVLHLHRLGSCRGLLVVSRRGLTFVPDPKQGRIEDGFRFRHGEFLHVLHNDNLTITSNTRTYRFKSAVTTGNDSGELLRRIAADITRLR